MGLPRYVAVALLAFCLPASCPANNPCGLMSLSGRGDSTGMLTHFRLASDLVGEWGYVRVGTDFTDGGIDDLEGVLVLCRAMHLIPVVTGFHLPPQYYEDPGRNVPRRDPDGSLTSFERAYEEWLREVYRRGLVIPYFEYGNEVNGGYFADHPEAYAEVCMATSRAFKRVDSSLSFGTAGMAGCALDFYEAMLRKAPELVRHVDHWGFHPYGVNHPPGYARIFDNYALDCHHDLVDLLKRFGVDDPVLIATETGYELGNQRDRRFPKITEELRARYLVDAYTNHWAPDPHIRAVMLFVLQDVRWQNWNGWDLVREDYSLTPAYTAIRDLPKPKGSDFLPSGSCRVSGRVTDSALGRGVEDFIVWIRRPSGPYYAAVTDREGRFEITGVPEGRYTISGFRDGFSAAPPAEISLVPAANVTWNAVVDRVGLVAPIEGPATLQVPPGYTASLEGQSVSMDESVKRTGASSLRIEANGRPASVWQVTGYESVLPGRVYAAEVWVKTRDLVLGKGAGASLHIQVTDSSARELATAEIPLGRSGTVDWAPLTLVVSPQPQARRLWVSLRVDAQSGTVWFDDLFVHEASWPLPGAAGISGEGVVSGSVVGNNVVFGEREYLADAVVFTVPLGKWTRTDFLGRYRIEGLPAGDYRIAAFHPDYQAAAAPLTVRDGESSLDLSLPPRDYPAELRNPGFEEPVSHPTWFRDWSRFGTTEGMQTAGWHKGLPEHPQGFQPHSGKGFYGAVAGSNIKDGGIFQTIAVEPHALYEVSVWSYTYQTGEGVRGDVANRLGVDPAGGRDPQSPYVIWTSARPSHKAWSRLSLRVRPIGPYMTVFLHHLQVHGLTFNCNLFDDVEVRRIGPPDRSLAAPVE
ncbi:MAG: hypothetical protein KatS3mg024_0599 [Armatimonadota bacterium]|nr:MAG: hypothetical protein KatS3mg024_0599 [Armatimonadota bacterium]